MKRIFGALAFLFTVYFRLRSPFTVYFRLRSPHLHSLAQSTLTGQMLVGRRTDRRLTPLPR